MEAPKYSIVVPVYNEEESIPALVAGRPSAGSSSTGLPCPVSYRDR